LNDLAAKADLPLPVTSLTWTLLLENSMPFRSPHKYFSFGVAKGWGESLGSSNPSLLDVSVNKFNHKYV